jgi:hypothetical protein
MRAIKEEEKEREAWRRSKNFTGFLKEITD